MLCLLLVVPACTRRLQDGKAAEADLKGLAEATSGKHTEHDLIRHNLVVFKGGEGAQQVGRHGVLCRNVGPWSFIASSVCFVYMQSFESHVIYWLQPWGS